VTLVSSVRANRAFSSAELIHGGGPEKDQDPFFFPLRPVFLPFRPRDHAESIRRYVPRSTPGSDAFAVVREHWPAFRERLEKRAGSLPAFVRDELEAFITWGDFEHGFLVAQCARCGDSLRVPFACKSRGICASCMGRRMAETAALLARHRLPEAPWRQWVLSFEGPMAMRLGYDRALLGRVCQRFAKRAM